MTGLSHSRRAHCGGGMWLRFRRAQPCCPVTTAWLPPASGTRTSTLLSRDGAWPSGSRPRLNAGLADMFLSRGFTTVVDLGSNPADTIALRRRIERGELNGPFIYTAGRRSIRLTAFLITCVHCSRWLLTTMPQPERRKRRAARARQLERRRGPDQAFTGSCIARAACCPCRWPLPGPRSTTTHLNGKLVFAHPSNLEGTRVAIESGVDVLAHAAG